MNHVVLMQIGDSRSDLVEIQPYLFLRNVFRRFLLLMQTYEVLKISSLSKVHNNVQYWFLLKEFPIMYNILIRERFKNYNFLSYITIVLLSNEFQVNFFDRISFFLFDGVCFIGYTVSSFTNLPFEVIRLSVMRYGS